MWIHQIKKKRKKVSYHRQNTQEQSEIDHAAQKSKYFNTLFMDMPMCMFVCVLVCGGQRIALRIIVRNTVCLL